MQSKSEESMKTINAESETVDNAEREHQRKQKKVAANWVDWAKE